MPGGSISRDGGIRVSPWVNVQSREPGPVRKWLLPGSELNQVVNPIGPVNQRAREFGAEKRLVVGRAALARIGQRILSAERLVASCCVAGGKDETPGAETLGVWC